LNASAGKDDILGKDTDVSRMKGFYNAMESLCSPNDDVEAAGSRHRAEPAPHRLPCAWELGAHDVEILK
jgi:hypothetical protein